MWPAWLALSPAYGSFLARAANGAIPLLAGDHLPWVVTFSGETFHVHSASRPPSTGIRVDARSVHFNWLILIPLLAGTAALGHGRLRARGAVLAILGLAALHIGFLAGLAEYRLLKSLGLHPRAAFGIFVFSQFYHSVGRIGIPILIWAPIGLHSVLKVPAAAIPSVPPAAAPTRAARRAARRRKS